MTSEEIDAFLTEPHLCRIGTIGPGGTVHLVTMNYGFFEGAPAFWTYRRAQKTLNLERNPTISMIVDTGRNYGDLKGVSLVGTAELRTDPEALEVYAESMSVRYGGLPGKTGSAARASASKRAVVKINVNKVMSWDHTKLGGSY